MTGFHHHRRSGRSIATFSGFEADLLRSLASQVVELLRSERGTPTPSEDPLEALLGDDGPTSAPEDPVLARLLPSAYPYDDEAAGEFRRYTESALRDSKVSAACAVIDVLEESGLPAQVPEEDLVIDVELDRGTADRWMRALTDVRLALAARLGVEEDDQVFWHSLDDDDPRAQAHDIYEWVGYLQETLVQSQMR